MTWSIIAHEPASGVFGIAVATRFFAVGALVPHIAPQLGAVATQALVNPLYGTHGLRLLRAGMPAPAVVHTLTAGDAGRDHRQVHVIDPAGRIAAHTGAQCVGWCGALEGPGYSLAGNMLAGPDVLADTAKIFTANATMPLAQRLICAMRAGEAAGGDKRGKQSAALLIYDEEEWPALDLRVDDHVDPLAELERLEVVSRERFVHFRRCLPSQRNPVGITDRDLIEAEIARSLAAETRP